MDHMKDPVRGEEHAEHLPSGYVLKNPQGRSYVLGRVLGRGGFGITYEAWTQQGGHRVAVKEFFPLNVFARARDKSLQVIMPNIQVDVMMKSFFKEIRSLCDLQNIQSVVKIYDCFYANHTAYYVMEFIEGDDLEKFIKKHGKLIPVQWEKQIAQLMQDIGQLHLHGVIHRDISPDNIKVTKEGKFKLLDFGSARHFDDGQNLTVHVKENFAPIEQYATTGQGAYTDVYALAATLYYCFTKNLVSKSFYRREHDDLVPPSEKGAQISREQEQALLKALAVMPKDRFQTMEAFQEAYFRASAKKTETTRGTLASDNIQVSLERLTESPTMLGASMALLILAAVLQILL